MRLKLLTASAAAALAIVGLGAANASTWIATGTGSDGPVDAQAVITTGSNSLVVALTNLQPNEVGAGQEISGIEIFLASGPTGISLTNSSGTLIDIAPGGAVTPDGGTIIHWGTALSAGGAFVATAGTGSQPAKPIDLIIDGFNDYSAANPSITGRNPQIKGTGTFTLSFTGAPNPLISSVVFLFGTGPDTSLTGNCTAGCAIPEPQTWSLMLLGFGGLGALLRIRRHRLKAA